MTRSDIRSEQLVFIHSALRPGCSQAQRLDGAEHLGPVEVTGWLFVIDGRARLVLDPGGRAVKGDLFRLSPRLFEEAEGYERSGAKVSKVSRVSLTFSGDRGPQPAILWQWEGPVDSNSMLASGDWKQFEPPWRPPWLTLAAWLIPPVLLGFFLLSVKSWRTSQLASDLAGFFFLILMTWPLMGGVMLSFASKRRERWAPLRYLAAVIYILWGVYALGMLVVGWMFRGFGS